MSKRRFVGFRVTDAEYQRLKSEALKACMTLPVYARRAALDTIEFVPRLEALEQAIQTLPDRAGMAQAFQRLAERIDRFAGKAGGA
jgi:hypothetical protein